MRALVGCESSGVVRDALRARGHDAWSCDLLPTTADPRWHIQRDVLEVIEDGWDLVIVHPPCTYLSSSGLHWNLRRPGRADKTEAALRFVEALWRSSAPRLCLENPQGCINTRLPFMPRPQYIQPYQFGEDASKKTGLWLRHLPPLIPTKRVAGRIVECNGKQVERWSNQTDSGQNRLPPSEDRWKIRSETYRGIAEAMAEQWGDLPMQATA